MADGQLATGLASAGMTDTRGRAGARGAVRLNGPAVAEPAVPPEAPARVRGTVFRMGIYPPGAIPDLDAGIEPGIRLEERAALPPGRLVIGARDDDGGRDLALRVEEIAPIVLHERDSAAAPLLKMIALANSMSRGFLVSVRWQTGPCHPVWPDSSPRRQRKAHRHG